MSRISTPKKWYEYIIVYALLFYMIVYSVVSGLFSCLKDKIKNWFRGPL